MQSTLTARRFGSRADVQWLVPYALGGFAELAAPNRPVAATSPLTTRESEVADLVALGLSNRDIAEALTISRRTADNHVQHILNKLGVFSRVQIATWVTSARLSGSAQRATGM